MNSSSAPKSKYMIFVINKNSQYLYLKDVFHNNNTNLNKKKKFNQKIKNQKL